MPIEGVKAPAIEHYWDQIEPLLLLPLERTGAKEYYTTEHVKERLLDYSWQLWAATHKPDTIDAIFVTYIDVYPTGIKDLVIYLVGGSRLDEWFEEGWNLFKAFAKHHGCKNMKVPGRKGWARKISRQLNDHYDGHYDIFSWDLT